MKFLQQCCDKIVLIGDCFRCFNFSIFYVFDVISHSLFQNAGGMKRKAGNCVGSCWIRVSTRRYGQKQSDRHFPIGNPYPGYWDRLAVYGEATTTYKMQ